MSDKKPTVESSRYAHEGFFDLRIDTLRRDDQKTMEYTTLLTKTEAAIVLAKTEDQKWVLNREYRHAVGKYIIGLPGGRVEKGEDMIASAKRELLEETGYLADTVHPLGICYPLPSICDQKLEFFFAPNVKKKKEPSLDLFEYIDIVLMNDEELYKALQTRSDIDAVLPTALTYYKKLFSF